MIPTKLSSFLLVFLFVLLIVSLSVNPVYADPDEETRRPNAVGTYQEWDLTDTSHWGATSDQSDSTYIYTGIDEERDIQNLQDSTGSGTINNVTVWARLRATGSAAGEKACTLMRTYDTDYEGGATGIDRGSWEEISTFYATNPNTGSAWTWDEVDVLQAGAQVKTIGSGEQMDCSEIWIVVFYTVEAGEDYVADLSQSIGSTWDLLTKTDYKILPSQTLTTSWDVLTAWDAIADFSQAITSSWDIVLSQGMFVDLSQSISSTWDVLTKWDAVADLSQSVTTSWEVLMQSTFNVVTSLSNTFSLVVDIVYTPAGGVDYIADLSQSLSTSWDILTEWDAILDLTQSITSTWEIVLSHGMFVDLSQSISSTWEIIVSHGMFVDLSQSIATSWDVLMGWDAIVDLSQAWSTTWQVLVPWAEAETGGSPGGWAYITTSLKMKGTPFYGIFMHPNSTVTVKGQLKDEFGHLLRNRMVTATLEWSNQTMQTRTGEEGKFSFQFTSPSTVGRYKITITYPGDFQHEGTEKVYTFTVAPVHPVKLTVTMVVVVAIALCFLWLGRDYVDKAVKYVKRNI